MKKTFSILSMIVLLASFAACTPKHDKTIANLKSAIDGEAMASAKYAAFADQAAKDSLYAVEALFRATSKAEAIHIQNHQAVLATLGVMDYQPNLTAFDVKSTAENLQSAIDGEVYESVTMYPTFLQDAEAEKVQGALVSFTYAQEAEKEHALVYRDVLSKLATPELLETTYSICPKCGNLYAGTASEICELCQTGAEKFLEFNAQVPAAAVNEAPFADVK